jgi:hypothetical protein
VRHPAALQGSTFSLLQQGFDARTRFAPAPAERFRQACYFFSASSAPGMSAIDGRLGRTGSNPDMKRSMNKLPPPASPLGSSSPPIARAATPTPSSARAAAPLAPATADSDGISYAVDTLGVTYVKQARLEKLIEEISPDTVPGDKLIIPCFFLTFRAFSTPQKIWELLRDRC